LSGPNPPRLENAICAEAKLNLSEFPMHGAIGDGGGVGGGLLGGVGGVGGGGVGDGGFCGCGDGGPGGEAMVGAFGDGGVTHVMLVGWGIAARRRVSCVEAAQGNVVSHCPSMFVTDTVYPVRRMGQPVLTTPVNGEVMPAPPEASRATLVGIAAWSGHSTEKLALTWVPCDGAST
jgi:hypothetical protein